MLRILRNRNMAALYEGYRAERSGNLENALTSYRQAAKSEAQWIKTTAERGADRVYGKLVRLGGLYQDFRSLNDLSLRIRAPFVLIILLFVLISASRQLWPRKCSLKSAHR